jgi:hypothetical protein
MDILIDFDGTCCSHAFPKIGKEIGAAPVLKRLTEKGHRLILFTMRCDHPEGFTPTTIDPEIHDHCGNYLTDAVNWFKNHNIPLWGIQTNPTQHTWTTSPKPYGHLIIDDTAACVPLIHEGGGERPYVDWVHMEAWLSFKKLI